VCLGFGGLKLINASPASDLVVQTVFWLPPRNVLLFVGICVCMHATPGLRRTARTAYQ